MSRKDRRNEVFKMLLIDANAGHYPGHENQSYEVKRACGWFADQVCVRGRNPFEVRASARKENENEKFGSLLIDPSNKTCEKIHHCVAPKSEWDDTAQCPECGKWVSDKGVENHVRDAHPQMA